MIEIKFVEGMEAGLSLIRSLPQTRNVVVEDHRATVELVAEDHEVAILLNQLIKAGVKMRSFGEKDPTLEDVFMMVTKGLVT
jgi:ABC-2 type transport system ATP-binding protein